MSKSVKVAAIQIQYPDGDVKQISIDDARALFNQLNELFGEKVTYIPSRPIVIERDRWRRWWDDHWTVSDTPKPPRVQETTIWCVAGK